MAVTGTVEIALEVPVSASLSVIAPLAHPIFEIDPSPSVAVRKRNVPKIFGKVPNNWGAFTALYGMLTSANGAMVASSQVPTLLEAQPTGGTSYEALNYSADRVNSIYGNSSTVQPAALRTLALIRAY